MFIPQEFDHGPTRCESDGRRPGKSVLDLFRPRINVYLLDMNENPSLRNQSILSGSEQNFRIHLDLKYLVTFYGRNTLPYDLIQTAIKGLAIKTTFNTAGGSTSSSNVHQRMVIVDTTEMYHIWDMIGVGQAPSLVYKITGLTV